MIFRIVTAVRAATEAATATWRGEPTHTGQIPTEAALATGLARLSTDMRQRDNAVIAELVHFTHQIHPRDTIADVRSRALDRVAELRATKGSSDG